MLMKFMYKKPVSSKLILNDLFPLAEKSDDDESFCIWPLCTPLVLFR